MNLNSSGDPSKQSSINNVFVIGAGLMGTGIATVCAFHGYSVTVVDLDDKLLAEGKERVKFGLAKMLEKNGTNINAGGNDNLKQNQIAQMFDRIEWSQNLAKALERNRKNQQRILIIESIVENLDAKRELLAQICNCINSSSNIPLIVSNTSSLLIRDIGQNLDDRFKQKFGGLHFFNPVPKMPLVEVIPSKEMQSATLNQLIEFVKSIGKVPIVCKDTPGFIANRILIPLMAESIGLVERGVANPEEVDTACELGLGLPIGPFRLLDFVGLDTARNIIQGWINLYPEEFPNLKQSKMLETLVKDRKCGRKTGQGFYKYSAKL